MTDVTFNLTTLQCTGVLGGLCPCTVGTTCNVEIFSSFFQQYLWDYDNQGLKNLKLRFYENPPGTTATSCPVP